MRYEATILGGLWWPIGHPASIETSYEADDDEQARDLVYTRAGDFSEVIDCEIRRVETTSGQTGENVYERVTTVTTVKAWESEDNESAYLDTIAGDFE